MYSPPLIVLNLSTVLLVISVVYQHYQISTLSRLRWRIERKEEKFVTFQYGFSRMGNQMFRIASGYGIARKLRRTFYFLILDRNLVEVLDRIADAFPATAENFVIRMDDSKAKNWTAPNSHLRIQKFPKNIETVAVPFAHHNKKSSCWKYDDPLRYINHSAKNLVLETYCGQNARFFKDYLSEIRQMFHFSDTVCERAHRILRRLKRRFAKTTCVHTRLTDFIGSGRTTDLNETVDAAHKISQRHGSGHYLIFGDDRNFMKTLASRLEMADESKKKTSHISSYGEFEDMYISSQLCSSFLISNAMSTFGWWLAFFAPNQDAVYYMNDQRPSDLMEGIPRDELFLDTWKRFS